METNYTATLTIPMPPTSNHIYTSVRGRLIKSAEYRKLESIMQVFKLRHCRYLDELEKNLNGMLRVDTEFYFNENRIYTKKKTLKKNDQTNRIKVTMDILSKLINKDDSMFVEGYHSKCVCANNKAEYVVINISKVTELKKESTT